MKADVAGLIWLGIGLTLSGFMLICFVESYTYFFTERQVTLYIRNWTFGHSLGAMFIGLGLVAGGAAAFTHFILDR